jgi:hypothetical protein
MSTSGTLGHGNDKPAPATIWQSEVRNGHGNGCLDASEKGRGDGDRVQMLRREVGELKEVIEGEEYLLQSHISQGAESRALAEN